MPVTGYQLQDGSYNLIELAGGMRLNPLFLLLPVLLPVAGGLMIVIKPFEEEKTRNIFSQSVVLLTTILVFISIGFVKRDPVAVYSFTRGFAIEFRMDGPAVLFAGMVAVMWPLVMLYAFDYMKGTIHPNVFFAFYVMTYGITLGVAFAANMTTLYVFYEMLTLVTIPLVSYYQDHESMYAGRKYAAYTVGGASLAFFAVVASTMLGDAGEFIYGGSLAAGSSRLLEIAFVFGFFGFGAKAAVFPLYSWLPSASVAPTPVTALLHAVAVVNSGVFAVSRLVWYVYGAERLSGTWMQVVTVITVSFTLVFAAVMALKERHFKRRLAYSTVSNLSYMLFGILLMSTHGFQAGMMHMLFHGVIKMSLFLCAGAFMHGTGNAYIYQINGIGRKMPVTFAFYTLGALSLTGIPLFCGFVSKWNLIMAGLEAESFLGMVGTVCLIAAAFLCAMYTLTVSIRAFFPMDGSDRYEGNTEVKEAHPLMLVPIVVFGILNVVMGIFPGPVMDLIGKIASGMI